MLSLGHGGTATVPLGQHGAPQPAARVPGQASSGGDQPAPLRRCALPVIAVFPGPEHLRPQFSVISSSRSLQELNLSVEPPSLTDEHVLEASRLWTPPPSGSSPGMSAARPSVKAEGCDQGASGYSDKNTAGPRCLPPAPCPHLGTAAPSGGPTPSLTTGQPSGCLEQALRGEPERLGAQARPGDWSSGAGTGDLLFGSSDIRPCILPWRPEGPECVFWKQCVCGGAVAVSHGRASRCCSADGVQRQDPPFRSHPSTRASTHGLASAHSNTENPQGSHQTWEVWASSFALGNPHALASSGGTAPIKGPDERAQSAGSPGEAGCLRREPPLAEGSATGPMDEVMLLCPSKAGGPGGPPGMSTLEQGTQTLGSRSHGSHPATRCVGSDAASWASMHSLSLHLSQLLHSTSELLGSLSQPSVAERECNAKRETPDEVPQALMMDSCTQTTMDEGVQTDLAAPPLRPQAPEADPQKVDVVLEGLGPDSSIPSKEKGHVLGTLEEREAEEIAWKTAGPQDLQEESPNKPWRTCRESGLGDLRASVGREASALRSS
uniref:Uncharacterized protein n=1 Tax=Catagonus wagneri TaxID=51154 RepID=A0A8C3YBX4_9CETA